MSKQLFENNTVGDSTNCIGLKCKCEMIKNNATCRDTTNHREIRKLHSSSTSKFLLFDPGSTLSKYSLNIF